MKRNKIISMSMFIIMAIISLSITQVNAQENDEVIRVGYYANFTDFVYDLDSLDEKGYGYEVFEKLEEISDLKFEYIPIQGDLIDAINSGYIDVGGFAIRNDDRRSEVLFSEYPFSKTYVALMSRDMDMRYNTPELIDGKTVATYEGNYAQKYLDIYCERTGISVEYVYGDIDNYMNLETHFIIKYSEDKEKEFQNNVLNLGIFNMYLMAGFDNQDMLEKIDDVFLQLVTTEGNYFLELEEKYLANNIELNHRGITEREINILRSKPLEVGYVADYRPISYTNEQGLPDGAMVETLNSFADIYGFEVNYHPYSTDDDPSVYENYDMLLTMYGEEEDVAQYFESTETYYQIDLYAQIRKDVHDSSTTTEQMIEKSHKVGMLNYLTFDYYSFEKEYPNNEILIYSEWHELLDAFAANEIDMLIATESAATYAELYLEDEARETINANENILMKFFVNKDISKEYIPVFNIMIDRKSLSEYEEILKTHSNAFYPKPTVDPIEFITDNWYYFALAALAIGCVVVSIHLRNQKKKQLEILHAYNTDSLTGFMAFHKFRETISKLTEKIDANEYEVISFDIDMFKTINTHFSTERGTSVIVAIGVALKNAFENTSAILCRKTGDQFLIFRKINQGGTMKQLYDTEILPAIKEVLGEKYKVSMSFGNVIIDDVKEVASAIIGQADNARVSGKNIHSTTFITFDTKMRKTYEDKINITFRMEQAVKDKEFSIVFQPKVDFKTLKVSGAEALVRWNPKFGDTIYPDQFIPVFEQNGFIASLDLYVLDEVCKFIKKNNRKIKLPRISVNLSAHTVLSDNILNRVSDVLEIYKVSSNELELELTESAIETDAEKFLLRVKQFKKLGFAISIDDFGAGVSSLNRLSAIEADVLKLDKAFFDLKGQGGKSAIVVANVINMAKEMDMKVVAEGVETFAQALWLREIECDYAQGYYFEKPMKPEAFEELLESNKVYSINITA